MNTNNQQVLDDTSRWLKEGHAVWFGTVIKTWGSSPRPAGSLMAVARGAGLSGSLSGGCIEEYLLEQFHLKNWQQRAPFLQTFGHSDDNHYRFDLPCGGELQVCLEYLQPTASTIQHITRMRHNLASRISFTRIINLESGNLTLDQEINHSLPTLSQNIVFHPMTPEWQMLLTGCGEVTKCVASLAGAINFSVTVCDFRPAFIDGWSSEDVDLHIGFPDDLIRQRFSDSHSAIITLAHDPRVDDMALMAALDSGAFYVGAMGSFRTSRARRQRLRELELSEHNISRLHAPAGYSTGSKTPWEIAISIMAEVIAARTRLLTKQSSNQGLAPAETLVVNG